MFEDSELHITQQFGFVFAPTGGVVARRNDGHHADVFGLVAVDGEQLRNGPFEFRVKLVGVPARAKGVVALHLDLDVLGPRTSEHGALVDFRVNLVLSVRVDVDVEMKDETVRENVQTVVADEQIAAALGQLGEQPAVVGHRRELDAVPCIYRSRWSRQ